MSKGISLEQFRSELETDAMRRNASQEKTIKDLHAEVDSLKKRIELQKTIIFESSSNCKAVTKGLKCHQCSLMYQCPHVDARTLELIAIAKSLSGGIL